MKLWLVSLASIIAQHFTLFYPIDYTSTKASDLVSNTTCKKLSDLLSK